MELVGYFIDGLEKCLVYEFMFNGFLEDRFYCLNGTVFLFWYLRLNIVCGIAKGIVYLNDCGLVYRDIKSVNVLLDENFVSKVGDFVIARFVLFGSSIIVVFIKLVIGIFVYMVSEVIRFDIFVKLDFFVFGVVFLEILIGFLSSDSIREEIDFLSYVVENVEESIIFFFDFRVGGWCI